MFQFRRQGSNDPFFAYERDILNLFPSICESAMMKLHESLLHPAIRELAEHTGVNNQDLTEAASCLAKFLNSANADVPASDHLSTVWVNSGFDRVKSAALLAIFFQIGVGATASYFKNLREAMAAARKVPGAEAIGSLVEQLGHAMSTDDPAARRRRRADAANNGLAGN